jgi:DNA modification methylase
MKDKNNAAAVWVDLEQLRPWEQNPRRDQPVEDVSKSISRFGFAAPILARRDNREIIAGHTRYKAAVQLGLKKVPVRWMDLDQSEARALALADNRLTEVAEWDDEQLRAAIREIESAGGDLDGLGFTERELSEALTPDLTEIDPGADVPDLQDETDSVPGGIYELGPHRLACGDSTSPAVWAALLGDERIQCVWTDPPYGIAYVGKTSDALTIMNDAMSIEDTAVLWDKAFTALQQFAVPGAAWYCAAPSGNAPLLRAVEPYGLKRCLIWVKNRFVMSSGEYHYRHEDVYHGCFPGARILHPVPRTADTVFEVARPSTNKVHPTMKPVELIVAMLVNSSDRGWIVADAFGGSGSTLIACAELGRHARLVELDPRYCDVIRRRWTEHALARGEDPGAGALT